MNGLIFSDRLPPLALQSPVLPGLEYLELLTALAILSPLPLLFIPEFPVSTDDLQTLKDALGDFILGADGDNLWGAPN